MNIQRRIAQSQNNIRLAIDNYWHHTTEKKILKDISEEFVEILAIDNAYAKEELREFFSKSPYWNDRLDAIVLPNSYTNRRYMDRVELLVRKILSDKVGKACPNGETFTKSMMQDILCFFSERECNDEKRKSYFELIKRIVPEANDQTRNKKKLFKELCDALDIDITNRGWFTTSPENVKLYRELREEFKNECAYYSTVISLNPAHFLTLSNPIGYGDELEYDYAWEAVGCESLDSPAHRGEAKHGIGYARDKHTFVVFTVEDLKKRSTLNYLKTGCQIFAYKPGSGVLFGGELHSEIVRKNGLCDLVMEQISSLEGLANNWLDFKRSKEEISPFFVPGAGFDQHPDWMRQNKGKVFIQGDQYREIEPVEIGTSSLCIICAREVTDGIYCDDCADENIQECDLCRRLVFTDYEPLTPVIGVSGEEQCVCPGCLEDFELCRTCKRLFKIDTMHEEKGSFRCNDCHEMIMQNRRERKKRKKPCL